jgi:hypothetical protein
MNQPRTYLSLSAYMSAVLETDNAQMPTRIYEALAAIEQRLLSPIEKDGTEYRAIEDAQRGLLTLRLSERVPFRHLALILMKRVGQNRVRFRRFPFRHDKQAGYPPTIRSIFLNLSWPLGPGPHR